MAGCLSDLDWTSLSMQAMNFELCLFHVKSRQDFCLDCYTWPLRYRSLGSYSAECTAGKLRSSGQQLAVLGTASSRSLAGWQHLGC